MRFPLLLILSLIIYAPLLNNPSKRDVIFDIVPLKILCIPSLWSHLSYFVTILIIPRQIFVKLLITYYDGIKLCLKTFWVIYILKLYKTILKPFLSLLLGMYTSLTLPRLRKTFLICSIPNMSGKLVKKNGIQPLLYLLPSSF